MVDKEYCASLLSSITIMYMNLMNMPALLKRGNTKLICPYIESFEFFSPAQQLISLSDGFIRSSFSLVSSILF